MDALPAVLVVDDKDFDGLATSLTSSHSVKVRGRHPSDVVAEDLVWADVVLLDYQLDQWDIDESYRDIVSIKPVDGVALASVLRRSEHAVNGTRPTAFAILTGELDKLADPLPADLPQKPLISRLAGIEWVWRKGEESMPSQITSLSLATRTLPQQWSEDSHRLLLGLAEAQMGSELRSWCDESALRCLPPIHAMYEWSDGMAFLRWMLHRILPFPCMLWHDHQVAIRLGLYPTAFRRMIDAPASLLLRTLGAARYTGVLHDFDGQRWWGAAIEDTLWRVTDGKSQSKSELRTALIKLGATDADFISDRDPVLAFEAGFLQSETQVAERDQCVRVRPDDWPAYANEAWMRIEDAASSPSLRAMVHEDDRLLLGSEE